MTPLAYVRKIHTVAETIWKVTFFLSPLWLFAPTSCDISFASSLTHHPRSFLDDLNENEPLSLVTSSTYASIFVTPFFASFIVHSFPTFSFSIPLVVRFWYWFPFWKGMINFCLLFGNASISFWEIMFLLTSWDGKFFFLFLSVSINWYLFVSYDGFILVFDFWY